MLTKSKSKKLLITSVAALGTLSLALVANAISERGGVYVLANEVNGTERTLTVNKANGRYMEVHIDGTSQIIRSLVAYQMSEKQAYAYIRTSQAQEPKDDVAFVLWGGTLFSQFTINDNYYDGSIISLDQEQQQVLNMVKYNHLTQIDIKLDKGAAGKDERILELTADSGKVEFVKDSTEGNYVELKWTPDNEQGYISADTELTFEPSCGPYGQSGKAIWCIEITFHYSC